MCIPLLFLTRSRSEKRHVKVVLAMNESSYSFRVGHIGYLASLTSERVCKMKRASLVKSTLELDIYDETHCVPSPQ